MNHMGADPTEYLILVDGFDDLIDEAQRRAGHLERVRRIAGAIAVLAGNSEKTVAERLGITQTTLAAWRELVASTPDEQAEVERFFRFAERVSSFAP